MYLFFCVFTLCACVFTFSYINTQKKNKNRQRIKRRKLGLLLQMSQDMKIWLVCNCWDEIWFFNQWGMLTVAYCKLLSNKYTFKTLWLLQLWLFSDKAIILRCLVLEYGHMISTHVSLQYNMMYWQTTSLKETATTIHVWSHPW